MMNFADLRGFMPSFVNSETGTHPGAAPDKFALMATGLLHTGIMFAKTYYERNDPGSAATVHISHLAAALLKKVEWETLLCDDNGLVDPAGTNIPMTVNASNGCGGPMPLQSDGMYNFNVSSSLHWLPRSAGSHAMLNPSRC